MKLKENFKFALEIKHAKETDPRIRNTVGVQIVRELVGEKRNHDCSLSLLITTSDLTETVKKEAEQFKVDYWHGAVVEQKLRAWGKWQPTNKKMKVQLPSASLNCKRNNLYMWCPYGFKERERGKTIFGLFHIS